MISTPDRQEAVALINEAVGTGARKRVACREIGITLRTLERWVAEGEVKADARPAAVRPVPANKLTARDARAGAGNRKRTPLCEPAAHADRADPLR
jgi:predicted site-specific integrase-resolvase